LNGWIVVYLIGLIVVVVDIIEQVEELVGFLKWDCCRK